MSVIKGKMAGQLNDGYDPNKGGSPGKGDGGDISQTLKQEYEKLQSDNKNLKRQYEQKLNGKAS